MNIILTLLFYVFKLSLLLILVKVMCKLFLLSKQIKLKKSLGSWNKTQLMDIKNIHLILHILYIYLIKFILLLKQIEVWSEHLIWLCFIKISSFNGNFSSMLGTLNEIIRSSLGLVNLKMTLWTLDLFRSIMEQFPFVMNEVKNILSIIFNIDFL